MVVALEPRGPGSKIESSPNMSDGAHDRQQMVAAVGGAAADLDLAGNDDVEPVAGLSFGEDSLPAREVNLMQVFR